jgi:NhaP-type Na+/H+ or K+/H+ antiporter
VVVGLRLLYLMPASWIARRLHSQRDVYEDIPMTWQETVIMWWSGMRGVVSVALALALPLRTHHHTPFPARQELLFITFSVVLATLLVQGLTLPWLVKRLEVSSDIEAEHDLERALAVRAMTAARVRLKEIERNETLDEELSEMLHRRAFEVGTRISPDIVEYERRDSHARRLERIKALRHYQEDMLSAARHEVLSARSEPGIDPEVVDRVLRHLDLRSMRGL